MPSVADISNDPAEPDPDLIAIHIRDRNWHTVGAEHGFEPETVCRRAACAASVGAGDMGTRNAELSIVLADDAFVRGLNMDYRGIDAATNVLAFPATEPETAGDDPALAGDVVVARETVVREAADQGKPLSAHLSHMIVHGVLHLFGFDHDTDEDADRMERLEISVLASLGIPDPYGSGAASAGRHGQADGQSPEEA